MWQENLLNNLLVAIILIGIIVIVYCKVKKVTLIDLIKDIREALSPTEITQ